MRERRPHRRSVNLRVPGAVGGVERAAREMVVDHPHRLHEGVADRRADEGEAALLEVPREARPTPACVAGTSFIDLRRFDDRPAADEAPHVGVEAAELLLHREEGLRVPHRALDLQAVADDPRVEQELLHARRREARHLRGIEAREAAPVVARAWRGSWTTTARPARPRA